MVDERWGLPPESWEALAARADELRGTTAAEHLAELRAAVASVHDRVRAVQPRLGRLAVADVVRVNTLLGEGHSLLVAISQMADPSEFAQFVAEFEAFRTSATCALAAALAGLSGGVSGWSMSSRTSKGGTP